MANLRREWKPSKISLASVLFICEAEVSMIWVNMTLIFEDRMSTSLLNAISSSLVEPWGGGLPESIPILRIPIEAASSA